MKFFDGLKRTGSKISFGFGKKGSRSRQGSAADEAPTPGDEASMSSGEDTSTSTSAPQQPSGGGGFSANMAGQHPHPPDDDDDFDPDEPMMTRLEQTMSNLEVKGNGEGGEDGDGGMRREEEDLGPTPRRFGPPHGGADDSTGGAHPSMLISGVDFSALSFLGRMNSDQWPQDMDGTAPSPVPGGPPSSAQGQSHPGAHHMASQQQYQYVPGSMAAPMPKLPSHHHQHPPPSNSSGGGGGNGEFMFFRSSGGESDKFKLDEPMGGADEEDLGPGLPPMLQSNSSINVYVPTKMRRMGSHTTGTYADPANSSKQELDTRHRHRDDDESRREAEQGGMEPPAPSGGGAMAPPSALSSASGNEIINLDNFRSNSSGTIPAQFQHTHAPSQQQFNSQGSAAGPVVGSGLDQSCIEAILMLSSGGREGQGQSGGSSGGNGSAWGSIGGGGSGGMVEASPSSVGVGAPPPDVCHVSSDVQSPVFVHAQQQGGARLPPHHHQQQQQQQQHLQQSPASMPHMTAYTSDPGLQHPSRMPGLQDVQGGPSEAWFPSDPTALLAAHMASSFTGVFRQDDPVQQQHQQQLQQQQDMRLQHLQQLQQQQQYATYDASGPYVHTHGAPPPHPQHYQPPYYADQYQQPHGVGMVPSSSSGDLDSDTMSVMTAASIQSSSGNLGGGGGHTRVQPGRQSKAKARQTIREVELEPVDGAAPEETVSTPSTQGTSAGPLTPMGDRSIKGMASKSMGSSTTMKQKDGAAERESLKGRYKCRYCGEIKSNHRCPALVDVPRAQIGTQTDVELTIGVGGRPVIPEDLYKCRFVTARVAPTSRAMLYGGPPSAPPPHTHPHAPHLASPGPMGPLPRTPGLPPGAAMGMAPYTSLCEAIPVVPPMPAQTGGAGPGAATSARVSYAPQPAMGGYYQPAPQQFMSPPAHTPTAAHTHTPHTPHTHPHDYAQLTPPAMTPHHTPHTHTLPPPHTQQPSGLPPIPSPHPQQPAYTTYSDYAAI